MPIASEDTSHAAEHHELHLLPAQGGEQRGGLEAWPGQEGAVVPDSPSRVSTSRPSPRLTLPRTVICPAGILSTEAVAWIIAETGAASTAHVPSARAPADAAAVVPSTGRPGTARYPPVT